MNDRFEPATTSLRCPRCRSTSFQLSEIIDAATTWVVVNGRLNRQAGILEPGYPMRVVAECGCSHHWTVRGASTINGAVTDLDADTLQPVQQDPE